MGKIKTAIYNICQSVAAISRWFNCFVFIQMLHLKKSDTINLENLYICCVRTQRVAILALFFKKRVSNLIYAFLHEHLVSFRYCFGVLRRLCQGRLQDILSFHVSPRATWHCVRGNIWPASCGSDIAGIVTRLKFRRPTNRISIPSRNNKYFSFPKGWDWLLGPHSILFSGYGRGSLYK